MQQELIDAIARANEADAIMEFAFAVAAGFVRLRNLQTGDWYVQVALDWDGNLMLEG